MMSAGDFLCVGDWITLFCEETEGYLYSWQSSSTHNGLYIYQRQDREKPGNIPNSQAVQFQMCIQNRYKLNKKYRKWLESSQNDPDNLDTKAYLSQSKLSAQAENDDNIAEQRRQQGKRVRYGEIIQLKHMFTGKFIHVSTTQTSRRDKNNMMVHLQDFNAKNAQFRILPRYKVKSEGEVIQIYDQIVFESVKSPGQFFHASAPWRIDHYSYGMLPPPKEQRVGKDHYFMRSELNLGVEQTGFTLVKCGKPSEEDEKFLKGGCALRMFHKELEAYVVAEGLFDEEVNEDVHLRIREIDQLVPKTLYPSSSGITYWQVEAEQSILKGDVLRWEQQIRFRHMTTRQYLSITPDLKVSLVTESNDPKTVFRLHPVIKETDDILFESYARIEHVLSGSWLHAHKDEVYTRRQFQGHDEDYNSMTGLRWDGAELRQISASGERMYDDAYTLQRVEDTHLHTFNVVAGMVPFLRNLIQDRKDGKILNARKTHRICTALNELKQFMIVNGVPTKVRQKLMRNLKIIDLLVQLVKCNLKGVADQVHLTDVFKGAYEVLYTYMIGNSRKNALYFAKYIDFFQTQFSIKGEIGLNVAQMIVELIRDNRKIVDRITHQQIDEFVGLLRENKNYRYLDLLSVLCVCDGVAIADNQTYITENWLRKDSSGVFLTERGQNLKKQTNVVFLSTDQSRTWVPLHEFVNKTRPDFSEEKCLFLEHQLDLFRNLCYGRNEYAVETITKEYNYLTWEEAFLCIRLDLIPDALRAKYCDLIICLFVDIGNNHSVLDHTNNSFVYDEIYSKAVPQQDFVVKDLVTIFPVLRDWITSFLDDNKYMTASDIGHNMLIEQVLRLLHYLVRFGYYGNARDVKELQKPLLNLLEGKNDIPFPQDLEKGYSKEAQMVVARYRDKERYDMAPETSAIVDAKYQAMQVLDLLMTYQFNTRLESFIAKFKVAERSAGTKKQHKLCPLLYETYDSLDTTKKSTKEQKKAYAALNDMFEATSYFDNEHLIAVLLDLSNYKYDKMVTKSLALLNKFYSSKSNTFKIAVQAQVLITPDSIKVHREVQHNMPLLRRLAKSKLSDEQVITMSDILEKFIKFCHMPYSDEERHPMNQSILINHEVLSLVFDTLSQEIDAKLIEQYRGIRSIMTTSLKLLKALAKGNDSVQRRIYDRLDSLLRVRCVECELAAALKEAFAGNQTTCQKVLPRQIQRIVLLTAEHKEEVPEFLDLLNAIAKVQGLDLALRRNQTHIMKFIMQNYSRTAYVIDKPKEKRERILTGKTTGRHLQYLVSLVELLSTCAEGENRFIESLCQSIIPIEEILWTLTHNKISVDIKKAYLKFLLWVYMRTSGSIVDSGAGELPHDKLMWQYLEDITQLSNWLTDYVNDNREAVKEMLRNTPDKGILSGSDEETKALATLIYFLDAVLPFLRTFFSKFYSVDREIFPREPDIVNDLANALLMFCDATRPLMPHPGQLKVMMSCMTTLLPASTLSMSVIEGFVEQFGSANWMSQFFDDTEAQMDYYGAELELNAKFRTFAVNASMLYGGHNTVAAQLKYTSNRGESREYTKIGGDEALPLGEEFQDHIRCFMTPNEKKLPKKYALSEKLVQQLGISATQANLNEATRLEQEELDIKCLQLLRAIIHNEERKLPEDWDENPQKHKKQLDNIRDIQNILTGHGAVVKVLPHLARYNDDIVKEVLSLLAMMLFNANVTVQVSLIDYFKATREEVFFVAIRNRMQMSIVAIKERRSLEAQRHARIKELLNQTKSIQSTMSAGRKALHELQAFENEIKRNPLQPARKATLGMLQSRASQRSVKLKKNKDSLKKSKEKTKPKKKVQFNNVETNLEEGVTISNGEADFEMSNHSNHNDSIYNHVDVKVMPSDGIDNQGFTDIQQDTDLDDGDKVEYKDEGYIVLVLNLLACMCDGQHKGLQDYLREQPDNIKTVDLIAETTQFVNMVYANINGETIDLVVQLFTTLNEFCAGNQANRVVLFNNKVIDYINFILRAGSFEDCDPSQVLELNAVIGNLLVSLIEENSPEAYRVAKEVKDTLDKDAIYRIMSNCYQMHQTEKPKWEELIQKNALTSKTAALKSAKSLAKVGGKFMMKALKGKELGMREKLIETGFLYYFVLQRMYDIDPQLETHDDLKPTTEQQKAFKYYKKNSMSIEIMKDDYLAKATFRVKNKNLLREEVKEKLKWSADRSSPTNKIRDLMMWSKDILKDIYYQRRILTNPIAAFLTKNWLTWNYFTIILSVVINILMLMSWHAPMAITADTPDDDDDYWINNTLPPAIHDYTPKLLTTDYLTWIYILGGVHNFFSLLVFISYFLSNHPQLPDIRWIWNWIKRRIGRKTDEDWEEDEKQEHKSKLEVQLFSFQTFYFTLFLGMSVAGTITQGYFFAFHLLNIVNNNQLLGGVIQAVTQNGRSLLWVAVLFLIVFYLYGLVAFALLRPSFKPNEEFYCETLWQCTITVVRYGMVGDLFERIGLHTTENTFMNFGYLTIFNISFFIIICTIGLNIIFGIIVDTFSELRDLKWTAESDMRDTCYICSRKSYDFEHHANGFDTHVKLEHNMWAYIFFFIHLDDTKHNDYTALDLYVYTLLKQERYDFFPLNRALSLSNVDEDSAESKLDELLKYMIMIVRKQRDEESEKKRREERMKQRKWQEEHRKAMKEGEGAKDIDATIKQAMEDIESMGSIDHDDLDAKYIPKEFQSTRL
ncbi:unnamed protein product [Owenia fusiformis]|uniref:Inositol 1,4,5-trisphosphate receptor n=1 Tax=Owenia fusiformis TaxID=6347 RepID=A0A8S4PVX0_OWEFU|nr:unnamed protein product [Owenia fusiformis]